MKNYRTYTYLSFLNIIFFLTPFTSAHSLEDAINSQDRSPKMLPEINIETHTKH